MIDVEGIKTVLKQSGLFFKETNKNIICKCPYCGDKKSHAHGYVSKDDTVPLFHCFFCGIGTTISKLLYDITGQKRDDLIVSESLNKNYIKKSNDNSVKYKIPELIESQFKDKTEYIKKRTFNNLDIHNIPNLIFDVIKFFQINNLDFSKYLTKWELGYIQKNMVCFLSKRNTLLYCRSISNNVKIKFEKIELQKTNDIGLDYYCIDNHLDTNTIVLSEGNFDILGCYSLNTLDLKNKARVYASGCTFSYTQLLKSVCLDYSIYKGDIIVLSDSDKNKNHYKRFINNSKPYCNSLSIYYNQYGKDFGDYPQQAVKVF